jgi:transposase
MSKNRVIVLSVTHQNQTIREVARKYGVSERWVYTLLRKYRQNGLEGLEPESKRPKTNPHQTGPETAELIKDLRISLIT